MKKIVLFCITLVFVSFSTVPAFAENSRPLLDKNHQNSSSEASMREQKVQANTINKSDNLKTRAQNEITRRITALKNLITRISQFKKISDTQKSTLTSQVQAQIDALNILLTKINADTDEATLKTDVQSIVQSYRIFALFMPQIEILGAADKILTTTDVMTTQLNTLQVKVTNAQNAGKTVTDLTSLLSDMKSKITDAKNQANNAISAVTPLTPDGYPGNKTTLQSAKQMLTTALKDLNTARQDARKVTLGLWKLGAFPSVTAGPHPTISCTPRPTCTPGTKCVIPDSIHLCPPVTSGKMNKIESESESTITPAVSPATTTQQ